MRKILARVLVCSCMLFLLSILVWYFYINPEIFIVVAGAILVVAFLIGMVATFVWGINNWNG